MCGAAHNVEAGQGPLAASCTHFGVESKRDDFAFLSEKKHVQLQYELGRSPRDEYEGQGILPPRHSAGLAAKLENRSDVVMHYTLFDM